MEPSSIVGWGRGGREGGGREGQEEGVGREGEVGEESLKGTGRRNEVERGSVEIRRRRREKEGRRERGRDRCKVNCHHIPTSHHARCPFLHALYLH